MADGGKTPDVIADEMNRLAEARFLSVLGELRIHDAEIVPNDVTLLNVEAQRCEILVAQPGKRIEAEILEALLATLDILEVIADRLHGRRVCWPVRDPEKVDRFQRCFEGGEHVFMRVAEETIGELCQTLVLRFCNFHLRVDQLALALEMETQIRSSAVRAEEADRVNAVVASAMVADKLAQQRRSRRNASIRSVPLSLRPKADLSSLTPSARVEVDVRT